MLRRDVFLASVLRQKQWELSSQESASSNSQWHHAQMLTNGKKMFRIWEFDHRVVKRVGNWRVLAG